MVREIYSPQVISGVFTTWIKSNHPSGAFGTIFKCGPWRPDPASVMNQKIWFMMAKNILDI